MNVKSLFEIASFNVAKYIWNCHINENEKSVYSEMCCRTLQSARNQRLPDIEKCLNKVYPCLPNSIQRSILNASVLIDKELLRWRSNIRDVLYHFEHTSWTPFFTIDKVKSFCKTKQFNIDSETLCECCVNAYVDNCRSSLVYREIHSLRKIFGNYLDHVILYWHWYGRQNRSLMSHVSKYNVYYAHSEPIENIFTFSVFIEYEVAVFHYWTKMTIDQRRRYHSLIIPLLLSESDNLEFIELNGILPMHTFYFFWSKLNDQERSDVVQYYFLDFYRYMLYHENGVTLIHAVLCGWNPHVTPMEYFKLLRLSSDTNNLDLFVLLWKRKLAMLSFEAIGHLMWTLLLQKDQNFKLSVMMINDYQPEQKLEVLNELDKRIECVQFDFRERIDKFLTAASLEHLRVTGFPRNPRPRREGARYRGHRRTHRTYH